VFAHALQHQFAHIAADGCTCIQRRVENLPDLVQSQQGSAQQRQLTRNKEIIVGGVPAHFQ
jgi:hypothetical protein